VLELSEPQQVPHRFATQAPQHWYQRLTTEGLKHTGIGTDTSITFELSLRRSTGRMSV
jgi:hypothetical protein